MPNGMALTETVAEFFILLQQKFILITGFRDGRLVQVKDFACPDLIFRAALSKI